MKKLLSTLALCFLALTVSAQLTDAEKEFAVKYLEATHNQIVETVSNLTEEQWSTQPENGGWSVANALEHILVTEVTFFGIAQQTVASGEEDPNLDLSGMDGVYIGILANRGTKVKTAAPFEPTGKWDSRKAMLDELESSRKKLIDYINMDQNLRAYKTALPFGEVDIYQLFLIISAHSQRHLFQMQEVLGELNAM